MLRLWAAGICLLACLGARAGLGDEGEKPPSGEIIRGVVVNEAGNPVAGAEVRSLLADRSPVPATTAADGSFQLTIVGEHRRGEFLWATAEGGKLLGTANVLEPNSSAPPEPARIVVKPSRTVRVHVRDDDGRPIAGAAVSIYSLAFQVTETSDAEGRAILRAPADTRTGAIFALKSRVGFDYVSLGRRAGAATPKDLPEEVTLTLDGARTVRIKAVDSTGLPVPGVEFYLWILMKPGKIEAANLSGSPLSRARTDERGVATFDWIPPRTAGRTTHFMLHRRPYFCPDNPSYPLGAPPAELTARLLRMTTLRGTVRQADGRPAPNIALRVEGSGATNIYFRGDVRTAEDGSYSIDVYPDQSYMIAVVDDQHAARTLTGIVVHEGQPWEALDLQLIEGTLIHGRVTRAPEGKPVAGVTLTLIQKGQPLPADIDPLPGRGNQQQMPLWGQTDADGRYQIRVGPGRFELHAPNFKDIEALTVGDEPEIVRDFHVIKAQSDRVISGRALAEAATGKEPIPSAIVEASTPGGDGRQVEALADGEGRFRLTINRERAFVVSVRDREGKVAGLTTVPTDAALIEVTARPAARIRGRVIDDRGKPLDGIAVRLRLTSGLDPARAGQFDRQGSTDKQGRYDFPGVPVGSWALVSAGDLEDPAGNRRNTPERREVRGVEPIEWPDLILPATDRPDEDQKHPSS